MIKQVIKRQDRWIPRVGDRFVYHTHSSSTLNGRTFTRIVSPNGDDENVLDDEFCVQPWDFSTGEYASVSERAGSPAVSDTSWIPKIGDAFRWNSENKPLEHWEEHTDLCQRIEPDGDGKDRLVFLADGSVDTWDYDDGIGYYLHVTGPLEAE